MVCLVWLDTGADHCVFPLSFAQALGLDQLNMKMHLTGGVGSVANATYYETITVNIHIVGAPHLTFTTQVGFTAGLESQGWGLLGQNGFFENFPTTFNYKAQKFTIQR